MAKGNMLQGQATGKVGDIVFMVRNGQQVARVYTSAGGRSGDQASIAVRRQRVRFGAASNQYLLYRNIVRGMYRTGKATKQSDYNFFVRENVDLLPYLTKEENAAGVKCAMPGTFSRGTLGNLLFNIELAPGESSTYSYGVKVVGSTLTETIAWTDSVGDFKAALKKVFPNARKVNYCVNFISIRELELPSGTAHTHEFSRNDVVFDLYEEDSLVPDTDTVAEYFDAYVASDNAHALIVAQNGNIMDSENYFKLIASGAGVENLLSTLYITLYASNDQVGDCYTSTCGAFNINSGLYGLALYSSLRTDDHRQVAEDSYGYATGVMRTNIQQA